MNKEQIIEKLNGIGISEDYPKNFGLTNQTLYDWDLDGLNKLYKCRKEHIETIKKWDRWDKIHERNFKIRQWILILMISISVGILYRGLMG